MKILLKNLDGTVSIMHPILDCGLTLEQIIAKDIPAGIPYEIVDDSAIPTDREFRNAWKHDLTVDIVKAREITKDRLREERVKLLSDLDVAYFKALELGTDTKQIVAEKKRLRDITKTVDTMTTLEELKGASCK